MNFTKIAASTLAAVMVLTAAELYADNEENETIGKKWYAECNYKARREGYIGQRAGRSSGFDFNSEIFIACCQKKERMCVEEAKNQNDKWNCNKRLGACFANSANSK